MKPFVSTMIALVVFVSAASAQQPFNRPRIAPVPVVSPPITNPFILQAMNPTRTTYVPGMVFPSNVYVSPWGAGVIPGAYFPPTIVQQQPGSYYRLPNGTGYNPWSGGLYSPWTDSFTVGGNNYSYNPWFGTYVSPIDGGTYNPWSGRVVRPWIGW